MAIQSILISTLFHFSSDYQIYLKISFWLNKWLYSAVVPAYDPFVQWLYIRADFFFLQVSHGTTYRPFSASPRFHYAIYI